jgi:hypothetical protein
MYARRCIGRDRGGNRCDFFFQFTECQDRLAPNGTVLSKGCGTKNDSRSKVCRGCGEWLDDPSENLNGKHYTENDLIPVEKFTFGLTKSKDKVLATYKLANGKTARELFDVSKKDKWIRGSWFKFIKAHCVNKVTIQKLTRCYNASTALECASEIRAPKEVTHRVNTKGFDVIARKVFWE